MDGRQEIRVHCWPVFLCGNRGTKPGSARVSDPEQRAGMVMEEKGYEV
jgi:hypothetical protein